MALINYLKSDSQSLNQHWHLSHVEPNCLLQIFTLLALVTAETPEQRTDVVPVSSDS